MVFLELRKTYGLKTKTSIDKLPTYTLDINKEFGLEDLSPKSLKDFRKSMENNTGMAFKYLIGKAGFNSDVYDDF
jgi:hypothetical protein